MIYFIQCGSDGPIKIGYTRDVEKRLSELQIGSPYKHRVIKCIRGDQAAERNLHAHFAHLGIHGEWFSADRELIEYIESQTGIDYAAMSPKRESANEMQYRKALRAFASFIQSQDTDDIEMFYTLAANGLDQCSLVERFIFRLQTDMGFTISDIESLDGWDYNSIPRPLLRAGSPARYFDIDNNVGLEVLVVEYLYSSDYAKGGCPMIMPPGASREFRQSSQGRADAVEYIRDITRRVLSHVEYTWLNPDDVHFMWIINLIRIGHDVDAICKSSTWNGYADLCGYISRTVSQPHMGWYTRAWVDIMKNINLDPNEISPNKSFIANAGIRLGNKSRSKPKR